MDTKEVEALAERMARQFITSHMRPDDIRLWEKSALVLAQVAYHWRDETRPLQAPPAAAVAKDTAWGDYVADFVGEAAMRELRRKFQAENVRVKP